LAAENKAKEASKIENDTLDFLKQNTVCYNDMLYSNFESPEDVFNLELYPELGLLSRAMIYLQKKFPLGSLISNEDINPVNLLRNIKYKNGKMLNIDSRTYTMPVLAGIITNSLKTLGLDVPVKLNKFLSSRVKKKDKLVLFIYALGLAQTRFRNSSEDGGITQNNFVRFLRGQLQAYIFDSYTKIMNNEADVEYLHVIAKKEAKKLSLEKLISKFLKYNYDAGKECPGRFRQEIRAIKTSKYESNSNKMISIEPNAILTFLLLGYYEYQAKTTDAP